MPLSVDSAFGGSGIKPQAAYKQEEAIYIT